MRGFDRRTFLKGGAAAAGTTLGVGRVAGTSRQQQPLRVGVFGGIFEEMYTKYIAKPFEQETGTKVDVATIGNVPNLLKLQKLVQQGRAPIDTLIHTTETLPQALDLDIYAPIPTDRVQNLENLYDRYRFTNDGTTYGAGIGAWFMTFILHKELVSEPYPSSWKSWWEKKYEGQIEAASPLTDSYLPWITAVLYFDGQDVLHTKDGIDEVFNKMEGVKPQISRWYQNEAQGQQHIRNKETPILEMWNDVSIVMQNNDVPIKRVVPKEGWVGDHGEWVVLKSSKRKQAAYEFINFSLKPEVQTQLTNQLHTAPTIRNTNLSEKERKRVFGPGPDYHIKPDWTPVWDHEEYIRNKWNKFLS